MAREITVLLEDRPGTLADLGEALGKAGVNLQTIAGFGIEGRGIIKILVEDAQAALKALEGAGIKVEGDREVLVVPLEDRPGSLGRFARKLANAGVNIDASYVLGDEGGRKKVVLGVSDLGKAKGLV